ncbi:hypothetical protein Bca4012_064987 [Brassica carinata]|uniref:Uncharacterized protein n=1 Tax=Brassica carinata TaxID=52824 RepID=A0A8X7VN42_BRACI|nr:hypothetical protein Bca52824_017443 [Brassica carinata]
MLFLKILMSIIRSKTQRNSTSLVVHSQESHSMTHQLRYLGLCSNPSLSFQKRKLFFHETNLYPISLWPQDYLVLDTELQSCVDHFSQSHRYMERRVHFCRALSRETSFSLGN